MNLEQHDRDNLFHLYDAIGKNTGAHLQVSAGYSVISTTGSVWPNCVYNISKGLSLDQIEAIGKQKLKPVVISIDDTRLDAELKNNCFSPVGQWIGMYRLLTGDEIFEDPSTSVLSVISNERQIAGWMQLVSEVLFKNGPLSENIFRYLLQEGHSLVYVEKDGKMIGTSLIYFGENNAVGIYMFCIKPDYQGKGLGKMLLGYCFKLIKDSGRNICVLQSTRMGLKLYESMGFSRSGTYNLFLKIK